MAVIVVLIFNQSFGKVLYAVLCFVFWWLVSKSREREKGLYGVM